MHPDQTRADNAIDFIKQLKHTKGIWKGVPFALLPWQEQALTDIFGTMRDNGYRQYNTAYIELPKKMGKALAIDTPIPTPCGWKTMGELHAGDKVFDENGNLCNVIGATDIMYGKKCYEVWFSDRRSIVADAEHLWKTKSYETKRVPGEKFKPEDYIHTTEKIRETLDVSWYANNNKICRNHAIEYQKGLKLPEKDLPIHPYVLGAWLGDGNSHNASITCAYKDHEIMEHIQALGVPVREWASTNKNSGHYGLTNGDRLEPGRVERNATMQAKLREMKLLKNKHIPDIYKRASYGQRLELLQGLMDTDGYIESSGQCEYTSTKRGLADDVRDLVNGLGIKANVCEGVAKLAGSVFGKKYRVQFYAYDDVPVARLPRKRSRQKPRPAKPTRNGYLQITDVRAIDTVPVKCIAVDSPSKLYLAGRGYIPTHNSEFGAAIALYLLCADDEHFAEIYGCAADRQNASIIFDVAMDMVDQRPALKKHIKPIVSTKRLVYARKKSYYQVLSAEAYSKHGYNVHGVIFDELHAQPNRNLFDVMTEGSGDTRKQPLFVLLTTAGDDAERASIGWEIHKTAVDILTGNKHDPTFYAVIYGLDRENQRIWKGREYEAITANLEDGNEWANTWQDETLWGKVNPSLGHTVSWDKAREQYNRALGNPAKEKNFRWLRLNSWEKLQTHKWLGLDFWDRCKVNIKPERLEGRPCYGGVDLSSKLDMTSFVLLFPPDDINPEWLLLPWFWIPEDRVAERVESDQVPYDHWAQQGYLQTTPGNVIDYRFIEQQILEARDHYDIQEIGYDPWNALQTAVRLEDEGLTVAEVRQGYKTMSPAMKEVEQLVRGKKLRHNGHPVLRWNVNNVEIKTDENENIRPVKGKNIERIDGLVATINAMARAMLNEEDQEPQVIFI